MDSIDVARQQLEAAEDTFTAAQDNGAGNATLDELVQRIADLEQAYYRACDMWEPAL